MGLRPEILPQVSAPFVYLVNHLDFNKIGYQSAYMKNKECLPKQTFVNSDTLDYFKQDEINRNKPIIVSMDNEIIDGHHRYAYNAMYNHTQPLKVFKIMLGFNDAIDIIKQIQGDWDIEKERFNDSAIVFDCYRSSELKKGSKSGNFLTLQPKTENDKKYQVKFENPLRVPKRVLKGFESFPTLYLAKKSFSIDDIKKDALIKNIPFEVYVNRLAHQYAKSKNHDGVIYGDTLIQLID